MNQEHEAILKIVELLDSMDQTNDMDCVWCEGLIRKIREIIKDV